MLVVKIGGSLGFDTDRIVADLVAHRALAGEAMVVVHGGSHRVDALGDRLGLIQRSVTSPNGSASRYTDRATLDVLVMAIAGSLNTDLVGRMVRAGLPAVGLSGVDGAIVTAERKKAIRSVSEGRIRILRDSFTGTIRRVDPRILGLLLAEGCVPVVSPPALDLEDGPVNVDADRMAAAMAGALGASCLILLTDRPGLLRNSRDETSLIGHVSSEERDRVGVYAEGRMKLKLLAVEEAIGQGVGRVIIASGQAARPLTMALEGGGTHFQGDRRP